MHLKINVFLIVFSFLSALSCSQIRLKHELEAQIDENHKVKITVERSISNDNSTMCLYTLILLGGTCWRDAFAPRKSQESEIISFTSNFLNETLGSDIRPKIISQKIEKISWDGGNTIVEMDVKRNSP